jgi:LysM repeat protein
MKNIILELKKRFFKKFAKQIKEEYNYQLEELAESYKDVLECHEAHNGKDLRTPESYIIKSQIVAIEFAQFWIAGKHCDARGEPLRPYPLPYVTPTPDPKKKLMVYKLEKGDSLHSVAIDHNVNYPILLKANEGLSDESPLKVGQEILIPPST